jgi:hypothetical protein
MKYHTLSQQELETYNIGYMVGNRKMVITDVEWESEQEHRIYRKGYMAGLMDYKRNVSNVSNVHSQDKVSNVDFQTPITSTTPTTPIGNSISNSNGNMDKELIKELEKEELAKIQNQTDDDFDRFWAAYTPVRCSDGRVVPKGSKKETRAKFDKYIKAGVKADDIIDGAKKYLASCQANDRLSCGATVFLNQERWKDDWSAQGIQATRKAKSISSPDYVGEGSFLRRAEDDPFCADL